jgi:AAA domain
MTLVDELSSGFYKKQDKSAPPPQSQVVHEIECVRADTVEQEPIRWLWEYRIAQKELCVFAGPPGTRKTTVVIDIVARLTRGNDWPDGAAGPYPSEVLMLISEDDLADTFAPRLTASGVDLMKVHFAMKTILRDTAKRVERQIRGQRQFARSEQAHPSGLWRW